MLVHGNGPAPARIMLIGEAPGADEVLDGKPFTGASGLFLNQVLGAHGLKRSDVFVTNVARERPPENKIDFFFLSKPKPTAARPKPLWVPGPVLVQGMNYLRAEVERVKPNLIVPMGNVALWAVEGSQSIAKWRGSVLQAKPEYGSHKVVPTWHPAYILRSFDDSPQFDADFHRIMKESAYPEIRLPERRYRIRPTLAQVAEACALCLQSGRIAADIETRGGQISCISFTWSRQDSICIPFMDSKQLDGAYWQEDEELLVWGHVRDVLTKCEVIGQNFAYDATYLLWRMGIYAPPKWDTMIMHHTLFAGMEKSLHFMASMYCEWYRYWKDDGKEWDTHLPEEQHWQYNCEDGVYTYELRDILEDKLASAGLLDLYHHRMNAHWRPLFEMSQRGVRVDKDAQSVAMGELYEYMTQTLDELTYILGHSINPQSSPQMRALFYEDFGATPILDKKTKQLTTNDDALELMGRRMPWLRPLTERILDYRSAAVLFSNMSGRDKHDNIRRSVVDEDGRLRTHLNITGAETYRLASGRNNFGSGMNMQNVTKGEVDERWHPGRLVPPNIRKMFIPDPGYTLADIDLQRADLVVVAREAGDQALLEQLEQGYNPYKLAAATYIGCSVEELDEKYAARYTLLKSFYHGTNYGGGARTMAKNCAMTVAEAERLQLRWFGEHPGIKAWHERIKAQLRGAHQVRNAFGYRRRYFDRPDALLPKALAWIPQSTVAIVTLEQIANLYSRAPWVQLLLQVHDSLVCQYPTSREAEFLRDVRPLLDIPIPYSGKPLLLKPGLATSTVSWGHVKKRPWQ